MKKLSIIFGLLAFLLGSVPAQAENYEGVTMYAKVNMHAYKNGIRSVNYHVGTLIPVNAAVVINSVDSDEVEFTVKETGQKVTYDHHKKSPFSVAQWIERQFSKSKINLNNFSKSERSAIKDATLVKGMSKDAAITAYGYPSFEFTQSTKENSWTYRKSRWNSLKITFTKGRISDIVD